MMKASEFDKKIDEGVEGIINDLDVSTATRLGVTRQSIIKV